jgi:hypothetical protein
MHPSSVEVHYLPPEIFGVLVRSERLLMEEMDYNLLPLGSTLLLLSKAEAVCIHHWRNE